MQISKIIIIVIMSHTAGINYGWKLSASFPAATVVCTEWQNIPLKNLAEPYAKELNFVTKSKIYGLRNPS